MYVYYTHVYPLSLYLDLDQCLDPLMLKRLGSGTFGSSTDLAGMVQSGSEENLKKLREAREIIFVLCEMVLGRLLFLLGRAFLGGGLC